MSDTNPDESNADESDADKSDADESETELRDNSGQQFGRLPATAADREVAGRASRQEVVEFYQQRFGIEPTVFEEHTFWEKGKGKIWIFADEMPSPVSVEGLGMTVLRTRQEHWKPTQSAIQRFGGHATKNVIEVDSEAAARFVRGEDQEYDWDGDWGYLIVAHEMERGADTQEPALEPIGVGLYVYGELRSTVPKGNREELEPR